MATDNRNTLLDFDLRQEKHSAYGFRNITCFPIYARRIVLNLRQAHIQYIRVNVTTSFKQTVKLMGWVSSSVWTVVASMKGMSALNE